MYKLLYIYIHTIHIKKQVELNELAFIFLGIVFLFFRHRKPTQAILCRCWCEDLGCREESQRSGDLEVRYPCHLLALPHFPVVQVYTTCNIYIYKTIPFFMARLFTEETMCHDQFVGQSATLFSIQPDAARVSGIAVWSRIGGMWRYSSFWPSVLCFDHWSYLFSREDKVEVSPRVIFLRQSYEFLPVKSNYTGFAPTHLRYSLCPPISIPLYLGCWEKPWWRVFLF